MALACIARGSRSDNAMVPDYVWKMLVDAPDAGEKLPLDWFRVDGEAALRDAWERFGVEIVARWAIDRAGTRPSLWWKFEAPEPRRRTGGRGDPLWIGLPAYTPQFRLGVPSLWLDQQTVDFYRERMDSRLNGVPVDPADPPRFESQAEYLRRNGPLELGERQRLDKAAFDDEVVLPMELWPDKSRAVRE